VSAFLLPRSLSLNLRSQNLDYADAEKHGLVKKMDWILMPLLCKLLLLPIFSPEETVVFWHLSMCRLRSRRRIG
jgi:hypothetical protein